MEGLILPISAFNNHAVGPLITNISKKLGLDRFSFSSSSDFHCSKGVVTEIIAEN